MDVYRIHNPRYDPLDGTGAAVTGGRWNPVGTPIVYTSAAFEGALLEQVVHANIRRLPSNRLAARIRLPEDVEVPSLEIEDVRDWPSEEACRRAGLQWLRSLESVALLVPSAVARPWGRNVLINPSHEAFGRVEIVALEDVTWDPRLTAKLNSAS